MLPRLKTRLKPLVSLSACIVLLVASACSQNRKVASETNSSETVVSSTPPFETKEPERYRATRTITTVNAAGQTVVEKILIARDGELRRDEFELGQQPVVFLNLPEGRFILLPKQKAYAHLTNDEPTPTPSYEDESGSWPDRLLHTEPIATSYQRIGTETIGGRATQKYRAVVNSSGNENVSVSESLIWIDEALHMPIRSESTSRDGKRVTMELSDITLDPDRSVFQIPEGYEKITIQELPERLRLVE